MTWALFGASALVIILSGMLLARYGTVIADGTGIGKVWVGAVALATATSLPEIATDSTAVLRGMPELGTGDLFGSNMVNMAILGLVALLYRRRLVIQREALAIALTAAVAIMLTNIATVFIVARLEQSIAGYLSIGSLVLLAVVGGGLLFLPEFREAMAGTEVAAIDASEKAIPSLARAVALFAAACAGIFVAAPVLVA